MTCLGSVSGGGSGSGFSVMIGGTFVDRECQLRLNARTLATLGYSVAAREMMCLDEDVRRATLKRAQIGRVQRSHDNRNIIRDYRWPPCQHANQASVSRSTEVPSQLGHYKELDNSAARDHEPRGAARSARPLSRALNRRN